MVNEKRLIDAYQFRGKHEVAEVNGKLCSVICYADIVNAPTVDAVEVVYGQWIPAAERLPEEPLQTVLVTNGKQVCVAVYSVVYEEFAVMCGRGRGQEKRFGVTHWMPLPEPPKGE